MVNKILLFILVFAICFLLREGIMLYRWYTSGIRNLTTARLVGIGFAVAYIMTIIITGFAI